VAETGKPGNSLTNSGRDLVEPAKPCDAQPPAPGKNKREQQLTVIVQRQASDPADQVTGWDFQVRGAEVMPAGTPGCLDPGPGGRPRPRQNRDGVRFEPVQLSGLLIVNRVFRFRRYELCFHGAPLCPVTRQAVRMLTTPLVSRTQTRPGEGTILCRWSKSTAAATDGLKDRRASAWQEPRTRSLPPAEASSEPPHPPAD